MTPATRVAVVDIGSNSTRLYIAEVEDGRVERELARETTVTRLGAGVDAGGRLSEEAMGRVYVALDRYGAEIDRRDCDRRVAVLTSAVRDSANGPEFAAEVGTRYRLEPHVLTGDEEARLTYLGATSERDPEDRAETLVFDIGGGSTELVLGAGHEVSFHVSTQAGVVRQSERHLHDDPPAAGQRERLAEEVRQILAGAVPEQRRERVERAIAVAGTATSLAAIAQELDPYDPDRVHGYRLEADECERILERLAAMTLEQRRHVTGLNPERAPTIVAGVLIFREIERMFGLPEVEISEHDILRGAALGLAAA